MTEQRTTRGPRRRLGVGVGLITAFAAGAVGGPSLTSLATDLTDAARQETASTRALAAGASPASWSGTGSAVGPAGSCESLLEQYVDRGRERVTAWGWGTGIVQVHGWPTRSSGALDRDLVVESYAARRAAPSPQMRAATSSATGTNVQERAVDEPDVVKTDGELLVRLDDGALTTYDVSGARPERLATTGLPGVSAGELLLVGDRAVVTAADGDGSQLLVVDLADPAAPEVVARDEYDARLVTARQHGGVVRLVLDAGLPDLPFVTPGRGRSHQTALARNRALVADTDLDDWLPHRGDGTTAADRLLGCDQVGVPAGPAGLGTLAVVSLEPGAGAGSGDADAAVDPTAATGLVTASDLVYASPRRLYLAAPPDRWGDRDSSGAGSTALHSFALDGAQTSYVASGSVDGTVRERWWMDERRGVLRVAVGPTRSTGRFNSVVTLAEEGDRLVEVGRLDGLGVGERIESVRWFDRMAIVVTFRRVDPLHAIDLSAATDPRLRGELTMPGYSGYLHPLGTERMIGIGHGPTDGAGTRGGGGWGAQAALFLLDDLDAPRKVSEHHYRAGTRARAEEDPRQFTWLPEERLALTVVEGRTRSGRTGWASVLDIHDGIVDERGVRVEHGDDVADVRLVPLPDGRVVLVTGQGVEAFDPEAVAAR